MSKRLKVLIGLLVAALVVLAVVVVNPAAQEGRLQIRRVPQSAKNLISKSRLRTLSRRPTPPEPERPAEETPSSTPSEPSEPATGEAPPPVPSEPSEPAAETPPVPSEPSEPSASEAPLPVPAEPVQLTADAELPDGVELLPENREGGYAGLSTDQKIFAFRVRNNREGPISINRIDIAASQNGLAEGVINDWNLWRGDRASMIGAIDISEDEYNLTAINNPLTLSFSDGIHERYFELPYIIDAGRNQLFTVTADTTHILEGVGSGGRVDLHFQVGTRSQMVRQGLTYQR